MNAPPEIQKTSVACFGSLVEDSLRRFPLETRTACGPPEEFKYVEKQQQRGSTVFQANFQRVQDAGEFRAVYIVSPVIEIVNLFFFPLEERRSPVFAMEFVRIGPRGVVGVVDCKAAPEDPACEVASGILEAAHVAYPQLQNGDDPPAWYVEARSGKDFFVRPDSLEVFRDLVEAHHFVWERYVHAVLKAPPEPSCLAQRRAFLSHYKDHHRDNSPGIPFLSKVFGIEWTQTFLRDHLFV